MKTIMLYGFLGKMFGRVHRYDVQNPREAVRALCATLQGFQQAFREGANYRVLIAGARHADSEQITHPVSDAETIRIIPVVSGAGGGIGQIVLGAAIFFAAPYAAGWVLANTSAVGLAVGIATYAPYVGAALAIGGVSKMLFSPKPTIGTADRPENKPSYTFDGAVNTSAQGNGLPILMGGPLIVGSQVISAGFSVEQI